MEAFSGKINSFVLKSRFPETEEMVRLKGDTLYVLQYGTKGLKEKEFVLDDEKRERILGEIASYISKVPEVPSFWNDERSTLFVESDANEKKYLIWECEEIIEKERVSCEIRRILDDKELLLFDGNPSYIETLKFTYWEKDDKGAKILEENLIINRKGGNIKLSGSGMKGKKYIQEIVASEDLPELLENLEGNEMKSFRRSGELEGKHYKKFFTLELSDSHGKETKQSGAYYDDNLPYYFGGFCDSLKEIIKSDMFAFTLEENYGRKYRKPGEDTIVKVKISEGRIYTYLADNEVYKVGDKVIVPLGKNNNFHAGRIEEIEFLEKEKLDFPVEKLKKVVGPYDMDINVASLDTPDSWIEKHKDASKEYELCEAYCGAYNEEKVLKKYLEDPMHVLEADIRLPQWTNLKKSYEQKLVSRHNGRSVDEIMYANEYEFKDDKGCWVVRQFLIE